MPFKSLNTEGTTAGSEAPLNIKANPERSHYFEIGSTHALGTRIVAQVTGYYKRNTNQSDAHQFNTTPMLNYFAYERGWQRGIDFSLNAKADGQAHSPRQRGLGAMQGVWVTIGTLFVA